MQGLTATIQGPTDSMTVDFSGGRHAGSVTVMAEACRRLPGRNLKEDSITIGIEMDGDERIVIDIVPDKGYLRVRKADCELQTENCQLKTEDRERS